MRKIWVAVAVSLLVGVAAGALLFRSSAPPATKTGERKVLYYCDPMNPQITSPTPKKSSDGMDYVPVFGGDGEGEAGAQAAGQAKRGVRVDPRMMQASGVRVEEVKTRQMSRLIRALVDLLPDGKQRQRDRGPHAHHHRGAQAHPHRPFEIPSPHAPPRDQHDPDDEGGFDPFHQQAHEKLKHWSLPTCSSRRIFASRAVARPERASHRTDDQVGIRVHPCQFPDQQLVGSLYLVTPAQGCPPQPAALPRSVGASTGRGNLDHVASVFKVPD